MISVLVQLSISCSIGVRAMVEVDDVRNPCVEEKEVRVYFFDLVTVLNMVQVNGLYVTQNKYGDERMMITSGWHSLYVLKFLL